ncbi:unnamed protein product [Rotaria sordida]|uniref:Uncharacterized protein n=1 Tax=Rotaria sordida TaxID=392033 RepID=A0A819PRV2_9BILA|nr:unnamed protein product [Rotaria sordida]CAF4012235.1 unnamed protein product [Rotaria sordida]
MPTTTLNDEILRLQSITNIFNGYIMLVLIIFGTVEELRQMPNSIFLISTSIGSLVLLWATRFPQAILAIANIDLLANSAIYCKIRWLLGRWGLIQENLWSTVGAVINFTMHTGTFYVYVIASRASRQNVLTAIWWKKHNRILLQNTHSQHEQIVHSHGKRTTHC